MGLLIIPGKSRKVLPDLDGQPPVVQSGYYYSTTRTTCVYWFDGLGSTWSSWWGIYFWGKAPQDSELPNFNSLPMCWALYSYWFLPGTVNWHWCWGASMCGFCPMWFAQRVQWSDSPIVHGVEHIPQITKDQVGDFGKRTRVWDWIKHSVVLVMLSIVTKHRLINAP